MSADNIVMALPFRKMTDKVVWRVMECNFSGLSYEILLNMSTKTHTRNFLEFEGKNAGQQASAAARRLVRELPICEYGSSVYDLSHEPFTMADLREMAVVESGASIEDVSSMLEAPDSHWARLSLNPGLRASK